MTKNVVLDASLTLAWCFKDEATQYTENCLRSLVHFKGIVPSIWFYETTNALVIAERRGRIDTTSIRSFLELLTKLPITMRATPTHTDKIALSIRELATTYQLSAYDATYLATAIEANCKIATLDGTGKRLGIKQAAEKLGIELFLP